MIFCFKQKPHFNKIIVYYRLRSTNIPISNALQTGGQNNDSTNKKNMHFKNRVVYYRLISTIIPDFKCITERQTE